MKFATRPTRNSATAAFTLAEVLAAMLLMAIVLPVALQGLHVASISGEIAQRKTDASRVGERILNENLVTTNWSQGTQSGAVMEGQTTYKWSLTSENWNQDAMQVISVEVKYPVRGQDYSVKLSTLANPTQ